MRLRVGCGFLPDSTVRAYTGPMTENPVSASTQLAPRDASGRLQPGARLNPNGRPVGSYGGIRLALQMVIDVANRNRELIANALQEEARKNPARFARQFILPNIPHKERRAFRERIRQMEVAAYDKAAAPFSNESKTQ